MNIVIFDNTSDNDYSFLNSLTKGTKTVLTRVADINSFRGHIGSGNYNLGVVDLGAGEGIDEFSLEDLSGLGTPLLVIGGRSNYSWRDREKVGGDNKYHLPVCNFNQDEGDYLEPVIALVATLSHEINNPLQSISANVEMLLGQSKSNQSETRTRLEKIGEAVARIREVLDHLMALETLRYHDVPGGRMLAFEKLSLKAADQNP